MSERLAGFTASIFGRMRELFSWPILVCGLSTDGAKAIPLSVDPGGGLSSGVAEVRSTAFEAGKVLKSSGGKLKQFSVFNSKASAQFILLMDSATVPADGPVTLLFPPIPVAAGQLLVLDLPTPLSAANGIAVSNSSTGTFSKTIGGADCAFYAQVI